MGEDAKLDQEFWSDIADRITGKKEMSDKAFQKIVDEKMKHKNDGFEVPAMRVDMETYRQLRDGLTRWLVTNEDEDINLEYEDAIGLCAGMEIIPDDSISEPVAEDVIGMWRDE